MLAHYLAFCMMLNRCIFFAIMGAFERWAEVKIVKEERSSGVGEIMHFLYAIGMWVCTKYHYHFPVTILILTCVTLMDPISYFYRHLFSGNNLGNNVISVETITVSAKGHMRSMGLMIH